MVPAEIIGCGRLIASVLQNCYENVTGSDECNRMENVLQVQRIIPAECLTGEPLLNSWCGVSEITIHSRQWILGGG